MTRTGTGSFGVAFQGLSRPLLKTFTAVFLDSTVSPWPGSPKWKCFLKRGVPEMRFHWTVKTNTKQKVLGCAYTLFKDNMITVTTVTPSTKSDLKLKTTEFYNLDPTFFTELVTIRFNKKINGKKLQKRMPRIGNHWPLVLWLHCIDLCRSRRSRTFWSYNPGL